MIEGVICFCCDNRYGAENNNLSGQYNLCYECEQSQIEDKNDIHKELMNDLMNTVMDFWIEYNYCAGKPGFENRKEFICEEF
jgi:hypothetical protein